MGASKGIGAGLAKQFAAEGKISEVTAADRQLAKAVNFGLLYGQRALGLVTYALTNYGVKLSLKEAASVRTRFFKHYEGLASWHQKAWNNVAGITEGRTFRSPAVARPGSRRLAPLPAADKLRGERLVRGRAQARHGPSGARSPARRTDDSDGARRVDCRLSSSDRGGAEELDGQCDDRRDGKALP